MIDPACEAEILRLYHVEKWKPGTIARQLRVHHDVVARVLSNDGVPRPRLARPSKIDEYLPFILETLGRWPKLTARRLYDMCCERGYRGSPDHFRHMIARYRPRPQAEAYLRLRTFPGEQAQVDWAHFGKVKIGRAERRLMAFVMVLSFSRAIFLRFFLGAHLENFLRGHEAAFGHWVGVPRVCLYDNLKSAVLERRGDAIRFNPLLIEFARHWRFEVRPVAVGRGNEKGRVERAIRFARTSFWPARRWSDLADLNGQALEWCCGRAVERPWPEDKTRTVAQALRQERGRLLGLPPHPFPTEERRQIPVGKTPYVTFDGNDYSVPHTLASRTLEVRATLERVRVLFEGEVVATHPRSFDRGAQIEDPAHVEALRREKGQGRAHRAIDRLAHAAPSTGELFRRLAERGENLGRATQLVIELLEQYGGERLEAAVREGLEAEVLHVHGLRQILERNRRAEGRPPNVPVVLPDDPRVRDLAVSPHDLERYDELFEGEQEQDEEQDDGDAI